MVSILKKAWWFLMKILRLPIKDQAKTHKSRNFRCTKKYTLINNDVQRWNFKTLLLINISSMFDCIIIIMFFSTIYHCREVKNGTITIAIINLLWIQININTTTLTKS